MATYNFERMCEDERYENEDGVGRHSGVRKAQKRPMPKDRGSEYSPKVQANHGNSCGRNANYSLYTNMQQPFRNQNVGGQFYYGGKKVLPACSGDVYNSNNRFYHTNSNMNGANFGTRVDDSDQESSDSGIWPNWNYPASLHYGFYCRVHNKYDRCNNGCTSRQKGSWSPRSRGHRMTQKRSRQGDVGSRGKAQSVMSPREKITLFGKLLQTYPKQVSPIQSIENGITRSKIDLEKEFSVDECKDANNKLFFTGVLKMSGIFLARSCGTSKQKTKNKAYAAAIENLRKMCEDESFKPMDPGINYIRGEVTEDVNVQDKVKLKCPENSGVQFGDSCQQFLWVGKKAQIPQINLHQEGDGGTQGVIFNFQIENKKRTVDFSTDDNIEMKIQIRRRRDNTEIPAEDLEDAALEGIKGPAGNKILIELEKDLDMEVVDITKGSIIIHLKPKSKDSIDKLCMSAMNGKLQRILTQISGLKKVWSAACGIKLVLNVTVYVPFKDSCQRNECCTTNGGIIINLRPKSLESVNKLNEAAENGQLEKLLTRITKLKQVPSGSSGGQLVMNVSAVIKDSDEKNESSASFSDSGVNPSEDQPKEKPPENQSGNADNGTDSKHSWSDMVQGHDSTRVSAAAPPPSDKFKDKEYSNWLKVALALYYMKSGLHTFIEGEVDCLHQLLVQKVYGGQTVPLPPCTTCHASFVKRNKFTGVWEFQKQCKSYCDVWLYELLKLHTNPKSEKIYWDNSHVPSWPFSPWECAKVFMPRGQLPSNNRPAECDAQALLTLLASCTHFHARLSPQGLALTHTVSAIRNKVMHASEMKLYDADRMNFIQQIIQLLEDPVSLKSLQDCKDAVGNIHKMNGTSLDVFFNVDLEMMALKTAIKEVGQELGIQEKRILDTVESLKAEYRQLEQQLTTKLENVEIKMDTIKRNVTIMSSNRNRTNAVEENLRNLQDIIQRTGENNLCMKGQTEVKLDTLRRLQCIPTKLAEKAKKMLEANKSLIIKGNPGEGKTTMAFHLIDNEKYRGRRVVVYCPSDWKTVDPDWVDIVLLEDIFGKFNLDFHCLQEWMVSLPTIQEHVDAGKLQVIITTRNDILSKTCSKLVSIKLFSHDLSLKLSSEQLAYSEKRNILNRQLEIHTRNMNEYDKEKCIDKFCGLSGFPQCCWLFAADGNFFDRGPDFFRYPVEHFVSNITNLDATRFLSLAFLFCNGVICEEYLSPEAMPESSKSLLMELASCLHISQRKSSVTLLRDAYESFLGLYIVKSMSCGLKLSVENPVISYKHHSGGEVNKFCIQFSHATVCEAVGQVLGDRCLEMVVKHGDSEYLYQKTYTADVKDNSQNVFIPVSLYGLLAERMVQDIVEESLVRNVVKHSALKQHVFLMKLKDELLKVNRIMDFYIAHPCCMTSFGQDLSEGECITFLQCFSQSDEDLVRLVYSQFLEFLECTHNNNITNCWQCNEKQKLLELALYYHHFEIADKLLTMNACYTHVSLCNAARHGDLSRVQSILEILKRSHVFSPEYGAAKEALCRAYISGNQSLIELFLQEGITLDRKHIVNVVGQGDMFTLMKVVEHMKCHHNWNFHLEEVPSVQEIHKNPLLKGLYLAYSIEKFDMADYLEESGVEASMGMLPLLSEYSSQETVVRVIQTLKDNGNWNPMCFDASEALRMALIQETYDIFDLLIHEGVSLAMEHLPGVISRALLKSVKKLDTVTRAIHYLKGTSNWNPNCNSASKALDIAYNEQWYDLCDLLIQEGVSLTMKNIHILWGLRKGSLENVRKMIQHLKDTENWDPKCDNASKGLVMAYCTQEFDVCDLLIQEGVSLAMKHLTDMVSLESSETVDIFITIAKAIHYLKDADKWDPKCDDASEALARAYMKQYYDVCGLLIQEGVSLTMKNFPVLWELKVSLEYIRKMIELLKDSGKWEPRCDSASKALAKAFWKHEYHVCDLLIEEGVTLAMKHLPVMLFLGSSETVEIFNTVEKAIRHLKDADKWDPKCDDASEALARAYMIQDYDVCGLLIQEGVSLTMKNLPDVVFLTSLETAAKAIYHLKDSGNWDPKSANASEALEEAYSQCQYDVCDLLRQEGVSLTVNSLSSLVLWASVESTKKAIKDLKDTNQLNSSSVDIKKILDQAESLGKKDICDLLIKEGVCYPD